MPVFPAFIATQQIQMKPRKASRPRHRLAFLPPGAHRYFFFGAAPVQLNFTVCGAPGALSLIVSVPE
jgi:hypothetical protein